MSENSHPLEQLVAANPVSELTRPDNLDLLVTRAMSKSAPRFAKGFRARMASAAIGASLLTTAGIAALTASAPSLPVLDFAAHSTNTTMPGASDLKVSPSMGMAIMLSDNHFVLGADGSVVPSELSVYQIGSVANVSDELARIADLLGISAPLEMKDGSYVASGDVGTLTMPVDSNLASWNFSTNSPVLPGEVAKSVTTVPAPTSQSASPSPSDAEVAGWATKFAHQLNVPFTIGAPEVSRSQNVDGSGQDLFWVSVPLLLDGYVTDQSLNLSFNADGQITAAWGTLVTLSKVAQYPTSSLDEAVSVLQQRNDASVASYRETTTTTEDPSPVVSGSTGPLSSGDTTFSVPSFEVQLTKAHVTFATYYLDTTAYLVPLYVFDGNRTPTKGSTEQWGSGPGTWSVPALPSKYVNIDAQFGSTPVAYGAINTSGPAR